jgi:prevent-host-death family protein
MTAPLRALEDLPSQRSSEVKNKWGNVVRQVQSQGSLAITNHSNVQMVLLTAETYQSLVDLVDRLQAREQSGIDELSEEFKTRLAALQDPQARQRVGKLLAAKGKARKSPVAGKTF